MKETDEQSRLRRYLAAYERLCKKYNLIVCAPNRGVYERFGDSVGFGLNYDFLPEHIERLKQGEINE